MMLDKEIRRATCKKLSCLTSRKGPCDSGLSKVVCPKEDDNDITDEITDPEKLFEQPIQGNKKHFSQANETYLAKPPHSEILPPFHYSPVVDKILEGNLNSFYALPPELKSLLTEMKALDLPHTIDPTMTITNFREGMKKVSEEKLSSLSGRNYSIYKAMLPDNYFTGKVVELINKGVTHGFVLKRWRNVLQVMLCKKPGNYNIDKLRVIQLIEADLNMYFRLVWGKRRPSLPQTRFHPCRTVWLSLWPSSHISTPPKNPLL